MFMIWDDHEIGDDYYPDKHVVTGGPDHYPAARAAYDSYVHSHNPDTALDSTPPLGTPPGNVLYYSFSVPGADFFVLDTRSYRSPGTAIDDEDKTMLGDIQRNALLDYLENQQLISTAAFKFIVSSVPFSLGEASDDTWSSYRTEREYILSEIEIRGITNVAFLSGDRHFSGIYRIISPDGYVYYDFLPSPTAAFLRNAPVGNDHPGEEEIVYISDTFRMFGEFEIDLSVITPTLRVAFIDKNGHNRCVTTIGNNETGVLAGEPLAVCEPPPGC
jgi:alkaline phosphatase D